MNQNSEGSSECLLSELVAGSLVSTRGLLRETTGTAVLMVGPTKDIRLKWENGSEIHTRDLGRRLVAPINSSTFSKAKALETLTEGKRLTRADARIFKGSPVALKSSMNTAVFGADAPGNAVVLFICHRVRRSKRARVRSHWRS